MVEANALLFRDSDTKTCLFLMLVVFREDSFLNVKLCLPIGVKALPRVVSSEVPAHVCMPVCMPSGSHRRHCIVKIAFLVHLCTEKSKICG